jgi:hypothetical protein
MPRTARPYMIGRYGMGTLLCLKNRDGVFILFNAMKIAQALKREHGLCSKRDGGLPRLALAQSRSN